MKRDIACEGCEPKYHDYPAGNDGPAEHVVKVYGFALKEYNCDLCNVIIPKETKCIAVSVLTEGQEYVSWESEFIESISKSKWDKANAVTKRILHQR